MKFLRDVNKNVNNHIWYNVDQLKHPVHLMNYSTIYAIELFVYM